jgi:hydroxymethylbilane synthase
MQRTLLEANPGLEVEIVTIRTSGDKGDRDKLGAFVREIQEALLRNEVDVALHCLKDLPTQQVPGLVIGAHLDREDPRDTMITRGIDWHKLPENAVVGTGSVRRTGQLRAFRSDLQFKPLVGNIDTRMRKLQSGEYDGIVLAIAGLKRLGVLAQWEQSPYADLLVTELDTETMMPAPGQAVLALETRLDDEAVLDILRPHNHHDTEVSAKAERAFLAAFGGGCSVPVAAIATCLDGKVHLQGRVAAPDGSKVVEGNRTGDVTHPENVGAELADDLLSQGAAELFDRTPVQQGGGAH